MTDTIAEQGALRKGIQDALDGVTNPTIAYPGFVSSVVRRYLNGEITYNGNKQTPIGRIIGYMLDNSLFVDFGLSSTTLDPRITWTRASTKTYYDIAGDRQTAAINEAPLEYDPITHELLGRSVWEARTNSLLNSDAPVTQVVTLGVGTYTLWVEGSGSATSSALTALGSGFGAATAGSPNVFTVSTGGTVTVTVTGTVTVFQLENGAFATPYIPTTGTSATRAADVASVTGTNFFSWYNQSEGTFVVDSLSASSVTAGPDYCARNSADATQRIQSGHLSNFAVVSGTVQASIGGALALAQARRASAYKVNDFADCRNGGTVSTDLSGTLPTGINQMTIGRFDFGGAEVLNGYIRSIKYYPTRLPDAQLQVITT
jgi:hypothetical protein